MQGPSGTFSMPSPRSRKAQCRKAREHTLTQWYVIQLSGNRTNAYSRRISPHFKPFRRAIVVPASCR